MKKFTILILMITLFGMGMAQVPSGIHYQTVIRNSQGNIIAETPLVLKMSIHQGTPDGEILYSEIHQVTTNAFGLVNIIISEGTPQSGDFSSINWGSGLIFLEVAVDLDGNDTFVVMGVTQFLSVPYAQFAGNGTFSMSTAERDALINPPIGMQILNTTTNCLNYYNGYGWYETCGDCTPLPSQADAGPDQSFSDETSTATMAANSPQSGTGMWSIVSGTGGSFDNVNDPTTTFIGEPCQSYTLAWTITSPCGASEDLVEILFDTPPTMADAGPDQTFNDAIVSATLAANTPTIGTGTWTVEIGIGGSFGDVNDPTTTFTGQPCETYTLKWTIGNDCGTSEDFVDIIFNTPPSTADAGPDQTFNDATVSATMAANMPLLGLGTWSVETGNGGSFENVTDPTTTFTGNPCESYTLKWTISYNCGISEDLVDIIFNTPPTSADAGPDQTFNDATFSATMAANMPLLGVGTWSVETGNGGSFNDVNDPTTLFTGAPCETYTLKWTIANPCGTSEDFVDIIFNTPPTTADAGPDQTFNDATVSATLAANTPLLGTGTWSVESGVGGTFTNVNDPATTFTGNPCETYTLKWTISYACGTSEDFVDIIFNTPPTIADAGADQLDVQGTSTTLSGNTPVLGTGSWSILSGNSGNIDEPENPVSLFTGSEGITYELQWTISNNCGSSSDNVMISFAGGGGNWTCGDVITDSRDGNTYETVLIGGQCWMAENLAFLPEVSPTSENSDTSPLYYVYDYQGTDVSAAIASANYQTYGTLYNWPASLTSCPEGWHLSSDDDWKILEGNVDSQYPVGDPAWDDAGWRGFDAGKNLKATSGWDDNGNGVDLYNFSALPGGFSYSGGFGSLGNQGMWWSSTEKTTTNVWGRNLWIGDIKSARYDYDKDFGRAVRCLKSDYVPVNQSPDAPATPNPDDGATNQAIEGTTLSWTCTDPEGDPLTYDVYFGTENPPAQVSTGQSDTTYTPGTLLYITQYFWKIIAHDDQGNSTEGPVWSFTTEDEPASFACGDIFTDSRDGNTYTTVQIGDQCWMKQNLKTTKYRNGSNITYPGSNNTTWENNTTGAYAWYNNDSAYKNTYGALYNWHAVNNTAGLCPAGWHVPTDAEWTNLTDYVSSQPEYLCNSNTDYIAKALAATTDWNSSSNTCAVGNNLSANDATGFSGLPGGFRNNSNGAYYSVEDYGYWWSSSESSTNYARTRTMNYGDAYVNRSNNNKGIGFSVRCIKSDFTPPNQSPDAPATPNPEDGATNQVIEGTTLSWTCTDPEGDTLTYDVYFGTENPPVQVSTGQSDTTYDPGTLQYITQYFWKIVAHDDQGNSTEGTVWSFTTEDEPASFACGDVITDSRDGQTYETVQIGDQCWMAENLNVGARIDGTVVQTDNGALEKYCYDNDEVNCNTYGGLYQWDEMMQYVTTEGTQGICPDGWQLPSDNDWKILEGTVDSQFPIGDPNWDVEGWRGFDVGPNLKSTSGWNNNGNGTDLYGFSALPGGIRFYNGTFNNQGDYGFWWSSDEYSTTPAWSRKLHYDNDKSSRVHYSKDYGFSVRCIKSDFTPPNQSPDAPATPNPADGAANQAIEGTTLSWTGSDPENDPLTYDVFFGTENPPSQASTGQSETTYTPGVLLYNTQYFWKIVANDDQGNSTEGPVWSFTTEAMIGEVYNQATGRTWMDRNLGASQVATSSNDAAAYGDLYQWGRATEGHEKTSSGTFSGSAGTAVPNAGNNWDGLFILGNAGWQTTPDNTLWQGVNGTNNPCPDGFRIPTVVEWQAEQESWTSGNLAGAFNSPLKLTAAGTRAWSDGSVNYQVTNGVYWSSTIDINNNRPMDLNLGGTYVSNSLNDRAYGVSVRCIKDEVSNQAPSQPAIPAPADASTGQAINTTLSWTCTDPESDALTYDVYFGTENPPSQVSTGQSETTYTPGTLLYNTQYFWKIVANDDQGNSTEGPVWSFTTEDEPASFACGDIFTDSRDGNTYTTVQIGDQCWMAENLAYLPSVSPSANGNNTDPFYYVYDYEGTDVAEAKATQNYQDFGVLYNWPASTTACPSADGWHTPTEGEWKILEGNADSQYPAGDQEWDNDEYRGFDVCKNLKSTSGWDNNGNGLDLHGFSALPGGGRSFSGYFYGLGSGGRFWTMTEGSTDDAWYHILFAGTDSSYHTSWTKGIGYNVRCLLGDAPANQAPSPPHNGEPDYWSDPQPVEGVVLTWSSLDAENDPITYDVFFGTTETPPSVASGQSESTFDPGTLQYDTQYFWKIVAHDDQGNSTNGAIWRFTTVLPPNQPPTQPETPSPENNSFDQPVVGTTLSWTCTDPEGNPLSYDVYFGSENPPVLVMTDQSETTYDPGTLMYNTQYFWKIVAYDDEGDSTEGNVWTFGTITNQAPYAPTTPSPEDELTDQPIEGLILSWDCTDPESDPLTYDIYFGTSNPPTLVTEGHTEESYDLGLLEYSTQYFWKIVAHDNQGNSAESVVWSFTTGIPPNMPPNQPANPNPANGANNLPTGDKTLSWTCSDPENDPITYEVFFGETNPPSLVSSGQSSTTFNIMNLNTSTTYYWKIIAHDDQSNITEGPVWSFTTFIPLACGDVLTDTRDGKTYNTVQIGTQCWMAENLNIGTMINSGETQTDNDIIEKYCYDNNSSNCNTYGGLYQYREMMNYATNGENQGLCPIGWHIPSDGEWDIIVNYLDGLSIAGGKMKETGTSHWTPPNEGASNSSGFTALPAGLRKPDGTFFALNNTNFLWSSFRYGNTAYYRSLHYFDAKVDEFNSDIFYGFSVRCIQD